MVAEGHTAGRLGQQHSDAIEVGHRRAERHQHVHIGTAVAQALVRAGVIVPADVELHRRGQEEEQPIDPQRIGPRAQQPQVAAHAQQEQRQGEDDADEQSLLLVIDLRFARGRFGVGRVGVVGCRRNHVITRLAHSGHQVGPRRRAGGIAHRGPLAGVVDRGLDHAVDLVERPLNGVGAVGASHAQQRQFDFGRGHVVAGAADAVDDVIGDGCRTADGGVIGDGDLLAGKINGRVGDALDLFGITLHRGHAVGAGHTDDGEGQLFLTHALFLRGRKGRKGERVKGRKEKGSPFHPCSLSPPLNH